MTDKNQIMKQKYPIEAGNFTLAGEASGQIKKVLKQLGVDSNIVRRVTVAAYEAEMNMVIHSVGGNLTLQVTPDRITVIAEDRGPDPGY